MSGYFSTGICLFMDIFNKPLGYSTGQSKFDYKTLVKMVQKLMVRHKSPGIKTVSINLCFVRKNVQIIYEKCSESRIPGSFFLETLTKLSIVFFLFLFPWTLESLTVLPYFLHLKLWRVLQFLLRFISSESNCDIILRTSSQLSSQQN